MEYITLIRGFGILNRTFLSYISKSLSDKELSYSDSIFLVNIGTKEGTSQEEIANALAIDKAAVARSVKTMEKKGYIKTEASSVDKRVKELYLTDSGKELYRFMQDLNNHWITSVIGDLDSEQINCFIKTIDHISHRAKKFNESQQF